MDLKKEKQTKAFKRNCAILVVVAVIVALLGKMGLFYGADMTIQDKLAQERQPLDGSVILVEIDSRALDELGLLPWTRDVYADVVEALNADPDAKPAAIGLDVVFAGNTSEYADDRLVEAVKAGGNVVVACDAVFGGQLENGENGEAVWNSDAILEWDEPFPDLLNVVRAGHINAVYDNDGILRHSLLRLEVPGEMTLREDCNVDSFAHELYVRYCENLGLEVVEPEALNTTGIAYISYSGEPGDFSERISVADILNGDVPGDYFEDCVVLIGPYDATLQDSYKTAISHDENMYGVEIQANIVQNYINGIWAKETDLFGGFLELLILGLLIAVVFARFGLKTMIGGWVLLCPGWILLSKVMAGKGTLIHPLYVPITVTVLTVVAIALHYISAALEKRRITGVFSRYVAPGVVSELLKEDESALGLGGKNVDVAVLFVDIRGFTTMSESMEPEQVVAILNDYLQLTTDCVMKNEGTLDKFVGDCTMAFWNAPLSQDDYIYKACRAAMDMVEGSIALTDELEKKFGKRVGFGVGVHSGPAVIGNIGAKQRMDFTAIGDTVNTASRLESNAPASTVYISRIVADALGDRAKTTSLGGSIKLKGKAEGFEVLTLDELE